MKLYYVECTYPMHLYYSKRNENYKLDARIEKLNPKKVTGSGAGFGQRDISFQDLTRKEADSLAKRARKIKDVKAKVRVQRY